MRTLKLIFGIGCFLAALGPASLAILGFSHSDLRGDITYFGVASIMAVLATGLVWAGCLFIAQRDLPMSRKVKVLIVLPLIGVSVVVVANFIKARSISSGNACINNLRLIDTAVQEFALEKGKRTGDAINYPDDLTPYLKDSKIPSCPHGGVYSVKKVGDAPTCSLGTTVNPPHVLP
jgi:hypothetical protein